MASQARHAIDWDKFMCLLVGTCLVFPSHDVMLPMLAVLMLQLQIIGGIDDVMQLARSTILKNVHYPFTLHIMMCWFKNIVSKNQSPTQIMFGSMDPLVCPFLNLAVYFESCQEEAHSGGNLFPKQTNWGIFFFLVKVSTSLCYTSWANLVPIAYARVQQPMQVAMGSQRSGSPSVGIGRGKRKWLIHTLTLIRYVFLFTYLTNYFIY